MAKIALDPSQPKQASLVKRLALGGVALTAATVATLGLYGHHADTFHHDTTRLLTEMASAKGIQVSLRDTTGLQIRGILLPKASASPNNLAFDGRLSYEFAGSQYNFTLLNDRAYVTVADVATGKLTRRECLHPENVPPFATLTDGLQHARVIDTVAGRNVTCASGKMIEFDFAGEPYVMCAKGGAVAVQGTDLQASLTLLSGSSEGVPSLASLAPPAGLDLATCAKVTKTSGDETLVKPSTPARLLQRTQDALTVATGGRRLGKMASDDCGCTNGVKKQCLFVHGFGSNDTGGLTDSFAYFGTVEKSLPCCASVKFVHLDTNNEPWYSDKLTSKVCAAAVEMTGATNTMAIENLQLMAHSMGNLIVSAAIMNNKCGLAPSSKWVSLAGPIYGTGIATTFVTAMTALPNKTRTDWCTNDPNSVFDDPIYNLLNSNKLCTSLVSLKSLVAKGSSRSTPELDALFLAAGEIFKTHVGANICGVSPTGILSADSAQKVLEAILANHPSPENDGQVHIDSCRATIDKSRYSTSWNGGAFYKASVNHLDIAMRHGDGWWGNDRKPLKWLQCQF